VFYLLWSNLRSSRYSIVCIAVHFTDVLLHVVSTLTPQIVDHLEQQVVLAANVRKAEAHEKAIAVCIHMLTIYVYETIP
jgi:hypothetical protein